MMKKNYLALFAKSFNWAGFFLPRKIYNDCAMLYAFCRNLDDIADEKNHLDNKISRSTSRIPGNGYGFGLGFAVVQDPVKGHIQAREGEASWGGMASTVFWVDPVEEISCIFLTQLVPSGTHIKLRWDLRALVNQAIEE